MLYKIFVSKFLASGPVLHALSGRPTGDSLRARVRCHEQRIESSQRVSNLPPRLIFSFATAGSRLITRESVARPSPVTSRAIC